MESHTPQSLRDSSPNLGEQLRTAPLIGVIRHRLATDGQGVTTLVAFHGCPLRCKYCLNNQCHSPKGIVRTIKPQELVDELAIDNLYFLATGGGVCFGGGEPLLYSEFISKFCALKVPEWKVTLETSLNVARHHLERVLPYIDLYYIDIKDTNPNIYHDYTECDNTQMLDNLRWLLSHDGLADRIIVRLPLIPEYNTLQDRDHSKELLAEMGIVHFDEFEYQT